MVAFLISLADPEHQEHVQKHPFLFGGKVALNRELRELWLEKLETRAPSTVPFSHEVVDKPLAELISTEDWNALVQTCTSLGLDEADARAKVNSLAWKIARAPRASRRILSIGTAAGHELLVLRALFPEAELYGVDYELTVPAQWRRQLRLDELKSQPIDDYLSTHKNTFDLIFSNHTLEHLSAPDRTLRLVHDALLPRGACVSALPLEGDGSNPYYYELLRIADGRMKMDAHLDLEFINPGHAWKTNRTDLTATFHAAGFSDIRLLTRANYPSHAHNHEPLAASQFERKRILAHFLERVTLQPLRRALRSVYPNEMPEIATKAYYAIAGRCWFSRLRMLHELTHEVVVMAITHR